jgi:hypothetical protein
VLQCMVERRAGGETGVAAVTCIEGEQVWKLAREGAWWRELAEAACEPIKTKPEGVMEDLCKEPTLFLLEYKDGFRGAVLMLNDYIKELAYAARYPDNSIESSWFVASGQEEGVIGAYAHFSYLGLNAEEMFVTGKPTYPVERTLLTSGVLEAALTSRHEGHVRRETPWLDVAYRSYESLRWRPTAPWPTGASMSKHPGLGSEE